MNDLFGWTPEPSAHCKATDCYETPPDLFAAKAWEQSRENTVVLLVPHSPETEWWREYVSSACEIWEVWPRIQFLLDGKRKVGNQWASAVVIWTPWSEGPPARRSWTWGEGR